MHTHGDGASEFGWGGSRAPERLIAGTLAELRRVVSADRGPQDFASALGVARF